MEDQAQVRTKKPINIPFPWSLPFIPLLFLGAAVSIPSVAVHQWLAKRWKTQHVNRMKEAGRFLSYEAFWSHVEEGKGTILIEAVAPKEPTRIWWVEEDIQATCPYQCRSGLDYPFYNVFLPEPELEDFRNWCESRFTNELSGSGKLVDISEKQKAGLREKLPSTAFLVTWKPKDKSRDRSLDS